MTLTMRDLVLGVSFLLAFPVAINLTDWAASNPGDPPPVRASSHGHP